MRVEEGDLRAWRDERVPVILAFYDAGTEMAYWTHIQETTDTTMRTTIRLPITQRFDEAAVETLRQRKNETV